MGLIPLLLWFVFFQGKTEAPPSGELQLLNYGVLGICVLALAGYIKFLHKEWKEDRKAHDEVVKEISVKSTEAIKEVTGVVSGLKTLLESMSRKR